MDPGEALRGSHQATQSGVAAANQVVAEQITSLQDNLGAIVTFADGSRLYPDTILGNLQQPIARLLLATADLPLLVNEHIEPLARG